LFVEAPEVLTAPSKQKPYLETKRKSYKECRRQRFLMWAPRLA